MPKLIDAGLDVSAPSATPLPVSAMDKFGFEPSDVTLMLPDAAPVAVGLNLTLKLVLCPAFRVRGTVRPLILNAAPVAVAPVILRGLPPEFVRV